MSDQPRVPISLYIVALIFFIIGMLSLLEVLDKSFHRNISLNFGVLGLFIGVGLVRFRPVWRTGALIFLWIWFIGLPVITIWLLLLPLDQVTVVWNGEKVDIPDPVTKRMIMISLFTVLFLVSFWFYRVLTRPDVRVLFGLHPKHQGIVDAKL